MVNFAKQTYIFVAEYGHSTYTPQSIVTMGLDRLPTFTRKRGEELFKFGLGDLAHHQVLDKTFSTT
ncbi:MAG: hypothetical protein BGO63_11305 [Candidatus Accumulibacter sp. 66-26]|nr:MAG: hypothetical protein BGO63_11305 [Candidatus Accumulibacter sp. 66-26]